MIDVQSVPLAQPNVFDAGVSVTRGAALTRPSGTALHVIQDAQYVLRSLALVGTCTREEWENPAYRGLVIARAWQRGVAAFRAEDEEFVSFCPVTLYRDWRTDAVVLADISLPGKPSPLITALGQQVVGRPADLGIGYRVERTSYARWAEGPLPHVSLEMATASTPDDDRELQALRHQNGALREFIDGALGPAEWAAVAADHLDVDDGLVDFRIRGVFKRPELRKLESKQTGDVSALVIDGRTVGAADFDPSTEAGLDALLEAE